MKRNIFFLFIIIFIPGISGYSQSLKDSITVKKSFSGTRFIYHGDEVRPRMMPDLLKKNTDATKEIAIAKNYHVISGIIGFSGGALLGFAIGQWAWLPHDTPDYLVGGIGAGLILLSIPFAAEYTVHAKKAVTFYNSSLGKTTFHESKTELKFGFAFNKASVRFEF